MSGVRDPAVAGSFYASTKEDLAQSLRECFLHDLGPGALPEVAADGPGLLDALVSPMPGSCSPAPERQTASRPSPRTASPKP